MESARRPRSRGGAEALDPVSGADDGSRPPLRGHRQPGDGRRDHGAVRCAPRPRGPRRAGLLCRTRHAGSGSPLRRGRTAKARVRVQIRVGLNSGEVVVRAIGSDLRMDYTAVGQTTHLAARMEQLAKPDTTLMTADVLLLAEGFIAVTPLGAVPVQGPQRAAEVYEMTGAGHCAPGCTRPPRAGPHPVRRRARHELEQLRNTLARAAGATGRSSAIVGEAGVGKSRLDLGSHALAPRPRLARPPRPARLSMAGDELSPGGRSPQGVTSASRTATPRARSVRADGQALTLDRARKQSAGRLALLDVAIDEFQWIALDPLQRRPANLDAVKGLLLRESQVQPLLLVFEGPPLDRLETQALLDGLVESVPAARLRAARELPAGVSAWLGGKTYYTQLRLDPLPVGTAPGAAGHASLAPTRASGCCRWPPDRADRGQIPFFLEESVRRLCETNALVGAQR
jgi:hypothetical protein